MVCSKCYQPKQGKHAMNPENCKVDLCATDEMISNYQDKFFQWYTIKKRKKNIGNQIHDVKQWQSVFTSKVENMKRFQSVFEFQENITDWFSSTLIPNFNLENAHNLSNFLNQSSCISKENILLPSVEIPDHLHFYGNLKFFQNQQKSHSLENLRKLCKCILKEVETIGVYQQSGRPNYEESHYTLWVTTESLLKTLLIGQNWINCVTMGIFTDLILKRGNLMQKHLKDRYTIMGVVHNMVNKTKPRDKHWTGQFWSERLRKLIGNKKRHSHNKYVEMFFDNDVVYFPLHIDGNHWELGVVRRNQKKILLFDSLGNSNHDDGLAEFTMMWDYISTCYLVRNSSTDPMGSGLNIDDWDFCFINSNQNDGYSCGAFTLQTLNYLTLELPITNVIPENIKRLRATIALDIVAQITFQQPALKAIEEVNHQDFENYDTFQELLNMLQLNENNK